LFRELHFWFNGMRSGCKMFKICSKAKPSKRSCKKWYLTTTPAMSATKPQSGRSNEMVDYEWPVDANARIAKNKISVSPSDHPMIILLDFDHRTVVSQVFCHKFPQSIRLAPHS
jgi:hypothetical protein